MSTFLKEYKQFFESPGGIFFLQFVKDRIQSEHEAAEDNPELSRDHVQRAKGMREVLNHVDSVMLEKPVNPYKEIKPQQ